MLYRSWPVVALVLALVAPFLATPQTSTQCQGDCDGSGEVSVEELVRMVSIALERAALTDCAAGDFDGNGTITVDEIVRAVHGLLFGCPPPPTPTEVACEDFTPERRVLFGDLHVHTTYSFDAHMWEVRARPEDAYRFARGQPLDLPPFDAEGRGIKTVRIDRPLDFAAVTDHSEFLGEVETCTVPESPGYDSATCATFRRGGNPGVVEFGIAMTRTAPRRFADICGTDGSRCTRLAGEVWRRVQGAAEQAYQPCQFTTFVAYEYSNALAASTRHRNVIFKNARVPMPVSTFEERTPQGLWRALEASCVQSGRGCDVLAIPHNSNESNGRMFLVEYPGAQTPAEERAQAEFRARFEPLVEIYQHKGNSECFNGLSGIVGAPDEACEFERRRVRPAADCGDGVGSLGAAGEGCISRRDYVRNVLLLGLQEYLRIGANPYALGFIGSTDTHNATAGLVAEETFSGHQGANDSSEALQLGSGTLTDGGITFSPGGLAAVWAEQNTREAIFAALRRRETYATSGPRIAVRVFGGYELPADWCERADFVAIGYQRGVPMGGLLPQRSAETATPVLAITAQRDPGTATRPGTLLQRIQVVKGWVAEGQPQYRVYDVAGRSDAAADVDLATCTPRGPGFASLCTVWRDPEFDPAVPAFYYVRVLENPSCRWHTYVCNRLPPEQRPPACSDPNIPATLQERAWTSPIWYLPPSAS